MRFPTARELLYPVAMRNGLVAPLLVASSTLLAIACGDSGSTPLFIDDGSGGSGGSTAGKAGAAGTSTGGSSGAAGKSGGSGQGGASAGAAGAAGTSSAGAGSGGDSGGTTAGGAGGEAGESGTSGQGGAAGDTSAAGGTDAGGANAGGASAGGSTVGGANAGGTGGGSAGASAGGASAGGASVGGSGGSATAGTTGSAGTGAGGTQCIPGTQLVYVFSSDNAIWSFDPPSKKFTKVATPDCSVSGTPNSMAIDRNLVAWINYIGSIYTFDLTSKKGCKKSQIKLPSGFEQVGMGFSTNGANTTEETLFLDGIGGGGLGKVDAAFTTVTKLGTFANDPKLSGKSAELTGTGDGRLFGYFTTSPSVRVAELDKTNANALSNVELTGVSPPSSWAFTFWGGEFYLYAAPGNNKTGHSTVVRYDPATKTVDKSYVADAGITIVGAGVSTCAPVDKP